MVGIDLFAAGQGVFPEEPRRVRYHLTYSGSEGEVKFAQSCVTGDESTVKVSIATADAKCERELLISSDLVQVKETDGSLRRLAFTTDAPQPQSTRFFYDGRLRTVDVVGGVGGRVEGPQSEGTVCAPMNGQVVKVPMKVGDIVECGDIVLILEAMKMENEVVAPIAGRLTELSVSANQTVSPGQNLFAIESVE